MDTEIISFAQINENVYEDTLIIPRTVGAASVSVSEILAGYVINGVTFYATGVSVNQHIANALHAATRWVKSRNVSRVYMTHGGSVQYAYDSQGCYVPPVGNKVCPRKLDD